MLLMWSLHIMFVLDGIGRGGMERGRDGKDIDGVGRTGERVMRVSHVPLGVYR